MDTCMLFSIKDWTPSKPFNLFNMTVQKRNQVCLLRTFN